MSNRAEEEKTGKLMKKGEVAGRSGEQEKRHKETNGKKATTAETKPEQRQTAGQVRLRERRTGRKAAGRKDIGAGGERTGVWAAQSLCLRLYNICFTMISFLTA